MHEWWLIMLWIVNVIKSGSIARHFVQNCYFQLFLDMLSRQTCLPYGLNNSCIFRNQAFLPFSPSLHWSSWCSWAGGGGAAYTPAANRGSKLGSAGALEECTEQPRRIQDHGAQPGRLYQQGQTGGLADFKISHLTSASFGMQIWGTERSLSLSVSVCLCDG